MPEIVNFESSYQLLLLPIAVAHFAILTIEYESIQVRASNFINIQARSINRLCHIWHKECGLIQGSCRSSFRTNL